MKFHAPYDSARPYIACFVVLRRGNDVAMLRRKNTGWMDGYFGLPAGKVEYGEPYTLAVIREAKEEAGVIIELENLRFVHVAHRHGEEGAGFMDWVDVYFEADSWSGEPHNAEPHKADAIDWVSLAELPETIVPPQRAALQSIAKGESYSEYGWGASE
jgi:8-oxo-dGTP diphosphatase